MSYCFYFSLCALFIIQKNGRLYEMNRMFVSISVDVINKFCEWSSNAFRNDKHYDKKMVELLLVNCLGKPRLAEGNIPPRVKKFVAGKFRRFEDCQLLSIVITYSRKFQSFYGSEHEMTSNESACWTNTSVTS